jgi:hypothetical protein
MISFFDIPYQLTINNLPYCNVDGELVKNASQTKFFVTVDYKIGKATIWNGEFTL